MICCSTTAFANFHLLKNNDWRKRGKVNRMGKGLERMKYLFIINDGPYGNERPYNALRLALNLLVF